ITSNPPKSHIWSGNGETPVVLVHTDWTFSDTDKYLGIKGGKASSGHGHMDAGSFVYDAYGVRWSEDLGMQSYAALENALSDEGGNLWNLEQNSMRWQVYRLNNRAHSTLTVNDADHRVDGKATIEKVIDEDGELGATLDMTPVLSDQLASAERTVKLVDETDLFVIDRLTALKDKDANVQWRMMTGTTVTVEDGDIKLTSSGKTMYLTATSSDPSLATTYTSWAAKGSNTWNASNSGKTVAGYTVTIPAGTEVTLTTKLSINQQ
ncbi:MAG: heparinase II/III-family protein, partial [Bacteroidales bacterium]|nr:heparinase II/III-family protein [Bacteroidales bacterium]